MINYDYATKENIKKLNTNWPRSSNHLYRILIIIAGVGSGKKRTTYSEKGTRLC